jgi:hypothetical protein
VTFWDLPAAFCSRTDKPASLDLASAIIFTFPGAETIEHGVPSLILSTWGITLITTCSYDVVDVLRAGTKPSWILANKLAKGTDR